MNKTLTAVGSIATLLFVGFILGYVSFPLALAGLTIIGLFAIRKVIVS